MYIHCLLQPMLRECIVVLLMGWPWWTADARVMWCHRSWIVPGVRCSRALVHVILSLAKCYPWKGLLICRMVCLVRPVLLTGPKTLCFLWGHGRSWVSVYYSRLLIVTWREVYIFIYLALNCWYWLDIGAQGCFMPGKYFEWKWQNNSTVHTAFASRHGVTHFDVSEVLLLLLHLVLLNLKISGRNAKNTMLIDISTASKIIDRMCGSVNKNYFVCKRDAQSDLLTCTTQANVTAADSGNR